MQISQQMTTKDNRGLYAWAKANFIPDVTEIYVMQITSELHSYRNNCTNCRYSVILYLNALQRAVFGTTVIAIRANRSCIQEIRNQVKSYFPFGVCMFTHRLTTVLITIVAVITQNKVACASNKPLLPRYL